MTEEEILRKYPGKHEGYVVQSVGKSSLRILDLEIYRRLKHIPRKISAYFHRDKIKEVFVADCFKRPEDKYYIIRAMDDTLFHVDY